MSKQSMNHVRESKALSFLDGIFFFLGIPKTAPSAVCFKCDSSDCVIDFGDGDYICSSCWNAHIPEII